jgi:uncharacterized protein YcbX
VQKADITGLRVYPVKSMAGIELQKGLLTPLGLENDRRYMVVGPGGRFVTQRTLHRLALVQPGLDENGLTLSMRGSDSITIPLELMGGERITTRVWGDPCETMDLGHDVSNWLTAALESSDRLRLVHMVRGFSRPQGQPENLGEETHTLFADAAPYLVANEASLEALNGELESRGHRQVSMNRFRPNIILRGPAPFAEHSLNAIASPNYQLNFCHPCQRCVVTTIDQATAMPDPGWQPYKTLVDINPMPGKETAPAFAHNAVLAGGEVAPISIGDSVGCS